MTDGAAMDSDGSAQSGVDSVSGSNISSSFSVSAFVGGAAVALLVGVGLAWPARSGAVELLVAVAVVQAVLAFAWVFGLRMPGRFGALVIAAMVAAAGDTAASVWPHSRLGPLLAVLGLAIPAMFVHQLWRGTARVRIVQSLSGIALLVVAVASMSSLLQLRHEFLAGADVVSGVVIAAVGALVAGYLVDLVHAAPRFDSEVPRGLLAVIGSAAVGGALGQLTLHDSVELPGGRALFAGAALGALIAVLAVAIAFIEHVTPVGSDLARHLRPILGVIFPVSMLAPLAFLVCLTIRA